MLSQAAAAAQSLKKKRGKARSKDKVHNHPKRHRSAYVFFSNQLRLRLRASNATPASMEDTARLLGQHWKALDEDEKATCVKATHLTCCFAPPAPNAVCV